MCERYHGPVASNTSNCSADLRTEIAPVAVRVPAIYSGRMSTPAVVIRDAQDADVPQILEIVNALLLTTTTEWRETEHTLEDRRAWLAAHRAAGEPVLVADAGGDIAGFASYGDFRDSQKWPGYRFVVEHTIHVRERYWRTGIGRALIEALIERAALAGKRVMVGAVDGENVGSIRFHERCGFVEVARMPDIGQKLGRRLTLVMLQRAVAR